MFRNSRPTPPRTKPRTKTGSLSVLMPVAILLGIIALGALAMDISHNVTVRTELQSATDSAALAGARDLISQETAQNAEQSALSVAETNTADGHAVSNSTPGAEVMPQVTEDHSNGTGVCTVDAKMTIENMFAKVFGRETDVVATHSSATAYDAVTSIRSNTGFPLAVSVTTKNGNGKPIAEAKIGDTVFIEINSQQYKNAAFTSFTITNPNASWLNDAVDMSLGFKPMEAGFIPGVEIGEPLNIINGVASQKDLAKGQYVTEMTNKDRQFVIPVMEGEPPYNQSRTCVGFITIKIKNIKINQSGGQVESFEAVLIKGITKGTGGQPNGSQDGSVNQGIQRLSPGTVQLSS